MPKDKRGYSHAYDKPGRSPYSGSSGRASLHLQSKNTEDSVESVKEWNEARCPVCMEHPHNAVLLLCSSHDKGCRPYMCDTSHRHSNCLDQFRKAVADRTKSFSEDADLQAIPMMMGAARAPVQDSRHMEPLPAHTFCLDNTTNTKLTCPLCRGQVEGWVVVDPARKLMNAKTRDCACETCDFSGNYAELRKHARCEHPLVRPSDADPERQRDWRRMEQEREIRDVFSSIGLQFGEDGNSVDITLRTVRIITLITIQFVGEVSTTELGGRHRHVDGVPTSESGTTSSRPRRLRSAYHWDVEIDTDDTEHNFLEDELVSDEGGPTPEHH